jgi:hypothetical protein
MSQPFTIDRVEWRPERALLMVDRVAPVAEELGGQALLEAAHGRVPYRTGELAASGTVERGEGEVKVGYATKYAVVLHKHAGDWNFEGGRSGTWLEDAIAAEGDALGVVMGETFRSTWGG